MSKRLHIRLCLWICLVGALVVATSCRDSSSSGGSWDPDATAFADGEIMQSLLPGLEAATSLAVPAPEPAESTDGGFPVAETIGTWNAADLPPTPAEMFALYDTGLGYARFPPEGEYIGDFYGSEGLLACVELRAVSDGWGEYQASLWTYPTLSTAIWRGVERYRLNGDTWDSPVPDAGGELFEELRTYYFDGREEALRLVWSRNWVDAAGSQIYDMSFFEIPASFSDPAFDYPDPMVQPALVPVPLTDPSSYAAHTEGTMTYPPQLSGLSGTSVEYYNQVPDSGGAGVLKHWKSFGAVTSDHPRWKADTTVVDFTFEDVGANRTERSKAVAVYTLPNGKIMYVATQTETTDITKIPDGRSMFVRESSVYYDDDVTPSDVIQISLLETGVDTSEYAGVVLYTVRGRLRGEYTATLDAQNGLVIDSNSSLTEVVFPVNQVAHLSAEPQVAPTIEVLALDNGGTFTGELSGGTLTGTYVDRRGRARQMSVTRTSIAIDGVLSDPSSAQ